MEGKADVSISGVTVSIDRMGRRAYLSINKWLPSPEHRHSFLLQIITRQSERLVATLMDFPVKLEKKKNNKEETLQ